MANEKKDIVLDNQEELEIENDTDARQLPYSATDIKVDKGFYTVFELKRKRDKAEPLVILDSAFQRDNVWSYKRKSELVESVLLGLPLPIFYLNLDRFGKLIVVDGRQRLTALFEFMDDKYTLKDLHILQGLNGSRFSNLAPVQQTQLEDFQLQAHVIAAQTPERIKYDIFDRVNRGGVKLNRQEIRNALYQGQATILLKKVASSSEFGLATGDAFRKEKRMKDKYLINRALGMYLYEGACLEKNGKQYVYHGDHDELLGLTMGYVNSLDDEEVEKLFQLLCAAMKDSYDYCGADAFRRPVQQAEHKNPINMNYFETIIYAFMVYENDKAAVACQQVSDCLSKLLQSTKFHKNITSNRDSTGQFIERLKWSREAGEGVYENDS